MSRYWRFGALLICLVLLTGCAIGTAYREVFLGNDSFSRGDYQEATVHYLDAQHSGTEYQAWISYNLGNVYHSLGEVNAAMELWNVATHTTDKALLFNVQFNRGIAFYESGHYDEAYQAFRETLELDPANMDAKLNLELTQKKLQAAAGTPTITETASPSAIQGSEDSDRLLEYVRRKEGRIWIPTIPHTDTETANDW